MTQELTIHVPAFTDFTQGEYLDEVINNLTSKDVIAIEMYHEVKDLITNYINGEHKYSTFHNSYIERMKRIDPELIKREPDHKIAPTFEHILKKLKGRNFQALETIEDYDYYTRELNERNAVIYKTLGKIIDKYIGKTNNIILLTASGHSLFIEPHIGMNDELDLNKYTKLKFKEIKKIEKEKQSIKIVYYL